MKDYDYIIVGAGLFGSVFAYEMARRGKKCLVLESRNHIGGNCYTQVVENINVHYYGAHIFHTSNTDVWRFMSQFATFNRYINSPIANYHGELYNLPFNMNTFCKLWPGVTTPKDAMERIELQRSEYAHIKNPSNLEEQALVLCGRDIYEKLIKGYSEKQWGVKATQIPAFVIRRLPFRFTFDNNYFNDTYQGIPEGGYTRIFEQLLAGCEVRLNTNFLDNKEYFLDKAKRVVYTGPIDAYFGYRFGRLDFRSLRFEHRLMKGVENYQGNAVFNYTDSEVPYTRTIEHKHFEFGHQPDTVVTFEYPDVWRDGMEPYYPVNDERNNVLFGKYKSLADNEESVLFGGRLGEFKYYDMDKVVERVLSCAWLKDE